MSVRGEDQGLLVAKEAFADGQTSLIFAPKTKPRHDGLTAIVYASIDERAGYWLDVVGLKDGSR